MRRVVIFTGDAAAFSVRWGIAELVQALAEVTWLIVEHRPPRTLRTVVRNQWRQLKREGHRYFPHTLHAIGQGIAERMRPRRVAASEAPGRALDLDVLLADPRISRVRFADIHGEAALAAVRDFAPDLGLSLAAPILKPALFEIPRLGTINLHKGKLPDFRGMPPAFWEMFTGAKEVGCTVHRVERKLDAGPVLLRTVIPVESFSTIRGLQICLDRIGVQMMCDAVASIANGAAQWEPQPSGGQTFRKPTLAQIAEAGRREPGRKRMDAKAAAKELVFWAYVALARPLPRWFLGLVDRQRITVILYHRVSDARRDSLTVGIEQFERQMQAVVRHCQVVSIEDLVRGRVSRRTRRPIVAVTFDDGYRDNAEHAAPVLLRYGVPAAFFVSTQLIESDRGFPHDREKLRMVIPAMDWRQVAFLHRNGFTVGSHTQTHINCVRGDPQDVEREIVGSMATLRERLGLAAPIFAYPYGGRTDFNEHWRQRVRQAGYIGCLSAYGERNPAPVEPFNVRRTGINHGFGRWAFRARLEGWA
jgi:methionyl-tRNA formyltransferase